MSGRQVVPISERARRVPEAGRIRIGEKTAKAMRAIPEFRFTSHDRIALDEIATMYGGNVVPWSDPKTADGQFEVKTQATEIRIVLPPDPLGTTPIYEMWSGGGCERRCDGVTAMILQTGQDGLEQIESPCLCEARQELACKVTTHLNVILPEVRFAGVWRLTTHSENAADELPGMVELIQQMQGQGLSYATLALKHRRSVTRGETHKYLVPVLGVPDSIEALAAGRQRLQSLSTGAAPIVAVAELEAGDDPAEPDETEPADEAEVIHDAEIVDDAPPVPPDQVCSLCTLAYGTEPLVKGRRGESKFVHTACNEAASTREATG